MPALSIEVASGVSDIDESAWNALLGPADEEPSPFIEWGFLASLEEAGTLGRRTGWLPRILILKRGLRLAGAVPAYVKLNSQGEFVFDFAFADLASRVGLRYYPKLLVGVPFTPVTGLRLLTAPGEDRAELLRVFSAALIELAKELELSSVHVNFARPDEIAALVEAGFVERHNLQYHWFRRGQTELSEYHARFNSKRRNQLKRELREVAAEGITIETIRGDSPEFAGGGDTESKLIDLAFDLYKSTVDKFAWGHQYLNRDVFRILRRRLPHSFELVLAQTKDGRPIAGAINFSGRRRLYGRYWGALEDHRFLHFNVCYYHGVAECLRRGLDVFEPGAGGEHKLVRGFEPVVQRSAHWFGDGRLGGAIGGYVAREREAIAREREGMMEAMGERKDSSEN